MNEAISPPPRRYHRWLIALIVVALLLAAGWFGWRDWQAREQLAEQSRLAATQQLLAIEQSLDALRRDQRANNQRIQDAAATNRILRDEMLGLSQRNALLEENLARLADSTRHGAQALRQEEAELLLSQAQQRLAHADDIDGAKRLYALAAAALEGIDTPASLNVRQALIQERNAVDQMGPGTRAVLDERLGTLAESLQHLPDQMETKITDTTPWWQRMLAPLVQIRPSSGQTLIARSERLAALDSLQLEVSLARAAVERSDSAAWQRALARMDMWMQRLWPDSPALRQRRAELAALQQADLHPAVPELGSTLQQLRAMRDGR